jgi:TatA/E family protein of Tat protein translocase
VPFLSPEKLLVILAVAVVVLGPDKLPKVAKQIGALWGEFRRFREKLESEVRSNLHDLPSTESITQAVRSPLSVLDNLADSYPRKDAKLTESGAAAPSGTQHVARESSSATNNAAGQAELQEQPRSTLPRVADDTGVVAHHIRSGGGVIQDEPRMN